MNAVADDTLTGETELERVERWRTEALALAGYPVDVAVALAANPDVDLHQACELLERGCDLQTALLILT